jgi:putative two-component system response regulator
MEQATILVVEDEDLVRQLLREHLTRLGHRIVTAESAEAALQALEETTPDLLLTDVHMGRMSGIELCATFKRNPRFQLTPVIILTGYADLEDRVAGLSAGADDFFAKPVDIIELQTRVAALLRLKDLLDQLERAESVIITLGLTIEARDPYTAGHCERLARYATALGRALGVDEGMLKALRLGGYLHDLGKIAVPDGILLKPGPLDHAEWATMRLHPVVGADLVHEMRTLDSVRPIIRHHHERCNGTGYPDGLQGEAIPLGARIMAVVDVYDALRTTRPYKPAMGHDQAMAILLHETEAGSWDPQIVSTFLHLFQGPDQPLRP